MLKLMLLAGRQPGRIQQHAAPEYRPERFARHNALG